MLVLCRRGNGAERNLQRDNRKRASLPAGSWIEPVLELNLEAPKHLFFDAFDVSKAAPTSQVAARGRTFNLYNKLPHQTQLVRVFFPQMLFANVRSLLLPVFGS